MDYIDRLRRFALNDPDVVDQVRKDPHVLDAKSVALVRIAALVAVGGAEPTYGAEVAAAVSAGATTAEIVDVLSAAVPIVGLPSVVAAAPMLSLALGYDPFEVEGV